jgi:hypothetical protein
MADEATSSTGSASGAQNSSSASAAATSALHENIKTKGTNSYYYAHATTAPPEARYVSGDGPPQLVSASGGGGGGGAAATAAASGAPAPAAAAPAPPPKLPVETYSWMDDEADVVLYIPLPTVEGLAKEAVACAISPLGTSVTITFPALGGGAAPGRVRCLVLDGLYAAISNARPLVGAKNSRLVVRLGKAAAAPWHKLLAADRPFSPE